MTLKFKSLIISFLLAAAVILIAPESVFSQSRREVWQPPEKIMDAVGVKPGMIIGEAGAGTGYLTFHLAKRVGPEGKIYANDINKNSLDQIRRRSKAEGVNNIVIVMGETEDPLFPEKYLDMVIMVYVLHHLEKPIAFLENIEKYLKPGAPLVIIEKNAMKNRSHYPQYMSMEQVLNTIKKTRFDLVRTETFLPKDTIYIYQVKKLLSHD